MANFLQSLLPDEMTLQDVLISYGINPGRQRQLRDAALFIILLFVGRRLIKGGYPQWVWWLVIAMAYAGHHVLLSGRYPSSMPYAPMAEGSVSS